MPIKYDELMALKNLGQKYAYSDREVMLYAYGIGMGADPMDEKELAFVNEAVATPRAAEGGADLCLGRGLGRRPRRDESQPRDGGRRRARHHLPPAACRWPRTSPPIRRVLDVFDKGKDKGAVIRHQTVLKNEKGEELATLVASRFARGDGGFGGPSEGQPEPHKVPTRAPDKSIDISTRPDQALVYRLCGDRNPLHSRSRIRQARRLPEADPARHVHLRHHLPRHPADLCRLRSRAPSGSTPRGSPRRSIPARP